MSVLSILIIPLCCFIISILTDIFLLKYSGKSVIAGQLIKSVKIFIPVLITEWFVFGWFCFVTEKMMFHDKVIIPSVVLAITSALPFAAFSALFHSKRKQLKKFLKYSAYAAVLIFAAEILLFNGKSFSFNRTDKTLDMSWFIKSGEYMNDGDSVVVSGDAEFILDNVPDGTKVLICDMEQRRSKDSRRFLVQLGMKDDNFKYEYKTVQEKYTMAFDEKCELSFEPYGNARSLKLMFRKISEPVTVNSIRAVCAVPFRFSSVRYGILLILCIFALAVKCFGLYKIKFSRRSAVHRIIVYCTASVCTLSFIPFLSVNSKPVRYLENEQKDYGANPYAQVFDAFKKGHVYLDLETDPEMEKCENIYDNSERDLRHIGYKWDFAYYKGHYYCYFGVAPVLVFYFPYYFIKGKLPAVPTVTAFFSAFAILFLCLAVFAAVRIMVPEPNLLLILLSMPAAVSCAGIYYLLNYADMYGVPIAAGMCFFTICLWSGISAYRTKRKILRYILFFISGTSLALCAASRPGMTVGAAVLLPFYFGILTNKKSKLSFRIKQASCFALPLIAGLAGVLWYNSARFDSIFEFGASYQLTVSDINANNIYFSGIPAAFYHFLLQLPKPINTFPFFEPQFFGFYNYERYKYYEYAIGILTYPFVLAGVLLIPVSIKKYRKKSLTGSVVLQRNAFIVTAVAVILFTSWQDFCLGGIIQRYVIDIMPLTVILSAVLINKNSGKKYIYVLSAVSLFITFCMGWLFAVEYPECALSLRCPNLYDIMEDLIVFWR